MSGASEDELAALARAELADELHAAGSLAHLVEGPSQHQVAADLTGGKDSRLLLAVALGEGIADQFAYQTVGPAGLPDVVVAGELASRFGLTHRHRANMGRHRHTYGERFVRFVEDSGGMRNAWLLKGPLARPPEVRVSGPDGYLIRSKLRSDERLLSTADLELWIDRLTADVLGAVRPDVARVLRQELWEELEVVTPSVVTLEDRVDLMVQSNSSRHMFGLLEELEYDRRALPFASHCLVQTGWALGGDRRRREVLFERILAEVDPWLLDHRLASGGWKTGDRGSATPLSEKGVSVPPARRSGPVDPAGGSFGSFLNRAGGDHRRLVVDDVLSGAAPELWEVLDRSVVEGALADYEQLTNRARRQLFGAATMAQWLSTTGR
ncbi:MAG: hypothetical protein JJU45_01700 [Acidimicrobiia bacterium]|nr:hypothetical protein [Acidimicrobiia bacterium]